MENPLVSIIIPVYNGSNYMREAIDSALAQTYSKVEVIVVNDGSNDGGKTREIALSYGNRIRYFEKDNGGVSTALNLGIQEMKGDYFSWLSHDDIYLPYKLETQVHAVLQSGDPTALIYGNWNILNMETGSLYPMLSAYKVYGEKCERSIFPVLFYLIDGCTMLIHRSVFAEYGLFDESLTTTQDYDMWFRIFRKKTPIYIDRPLTNNRVHRAQGSATLSDFSANAQDLHIRMMESLTEKEIDLFFGGAFHYFYDMLLICLAKNWAKPIPALYRSFLNARPTPASLSSARIEDDEIYIYGAGKIGHRVLADCLMKGLKVRGILDRRQSLWHTQIYGINCLPIEEIDQSEAVWIAVEDDHDILTNLHRNGFSSVKAYQEVSRSVYALSPVKNEVIRFMEQYLKDTKT